MIPSPRIAPGTSWLLDLLRGGAALGVAFCHHVIAGLAAWPDRFERHGHQFVVIFFVLSGYVITATTATTRPSWKRFAAARLGRLWSVALPALALTGLLGVVGLELAPQAYGVNVRGDEVVRLGACAAFLNELWFLNLAPKLNAPLWSLAYEAWYYALFAAAWFVPAGPRRWAAVTLVALVAGPKILALLPLWLLGAGLWWWRGRVTLGRGAAAALLAAGVVLVTAIAVAHPAWPGTLGMPPWYYSATAIADLLLGLGVAAIIAGFDHGWGQLAPPRWAVAVVRPFAGMSFSLYLLHFPLMFFVGHGIVIDRHSVASVAGWGVGILVFCGLFAWVFEPRRHLLARGLRWVLGERAASAAPAGSPPPAPGPR